MNDRDALIERVSADLAGCVDLSYGTIPVDRDDLRALISLASQRMHEAPRSKIPSKPVEEHIADLEAAKAKSLASPSPAQTSDREAGEWVNRGEGWEWISTSPAQWPEDVVERVVEAFKTAEAQQEREAAWEGDFTPDIRWSMRAALATLPPPACNCEDAQRYKDALSDLLSCRGEQEAIGGGPGWQERDRKAWDAAEELMRIEP